MALTVSAVISFGAAAPGISTDAITRSARRQSVSMASLVFAAKRAGFLNETQAQYIWKQFNIHKIRLREPPELDFPAEEPCTLSDLVSLHINDMGYSVADLSKVLMMNETEVAKTYSINLPGQEKGRTHLRVIQ